MTTRDVTDLIHELLLLYGHGLLGREEGLGVRALHGGRTGLLALTAGGREFRIAITRKPAGRGRRPAA